MLSPAGPAESLPRRVLEDHASDGEVAEDPAGAAPPVADHRGADRGVAEWPDARRRQTPAGAGGVLDMEAVAA